MQTKQYKEEINNKNMYQIHTEKLHMNKGRDLKSISICNNIILLNLLK